MANVWEAMKKHQAQQAKQETAAPEKPAPSDHEAARATIPVVPRTAISVSTPATSSGDVASYISAGPVTEEIAQASTAAKQLLSKAASKPKENASVLRKRISLDLCTFHDRGGRNAEEYRGLRTSLLAQCRQKDFCYLVTSALENEGKTVTCLNLATVLTERVSQNTLVIDADLRHRRVAELLGIHRSPGLADCLRGSMTLDEAIQPTTFRNLSILSAGQVKQSRVAELLARPELEAILAEARKRFDYIIIDTPPIISVSDAGIIGRGCPQALVVVRMGYTQRQMVRRALALLEAANVEPMGIVLTHRKLYDPHYAYRYK